MQNCETRKEMVKWVKFREIRLMFNNLYGVSSCVWEQMDTGRHVYPYIKATHHEWNNSKEERFPLWLPRTTLCVWMCCSDHYSKGDSHTTRIDLHCDETFNTGNSESCLCNSIVMIVCTLRVKTWEHRLLESLHNGECISWPQSDYCDQNKCMT